MVLLEQLLNLFDCKTEQEWSASLFKTAKNSGFEQVLYGVLPGKKKPDVLSFLQSNYHQDWLATYEQSALHRIDPVFAHCTVSALPIMWTPDTFKGRLQKELYERACEYNLRFGISYPVHGPQGECGTLSFVADNVNHEAYSGRPLVLGELSLIRDYVLESSQKFLTVSPSIEAPTKLTVRELECIKWVMSGKSSWEISQILHCSEATINFHVANMKKKFNVQTRQQAVIKAIKEKLIIPA
ncbi:LuxR family transcriptional regulator [Glaciimonas sp. GNP009]